MTLTHLNPYPCEGSGVLAGKGTGLKTNTPGLPVTISRYGELSIQVSEQSQVPDDEEDHGANHDYHSGKGAHSVKAYTQGVHHLFE